MNTESNLAILQCEQKKRRALGEHLTSISIFDEFIFPQIKELLFKHCWVDLYCGEGNLILPILDKIPSSERVDFFKNHIYLFDIQHNMVKRCIQNAVGYGIPRDIAHQNIKVKDTLKEFPEFIRKNPYPVFHITNPPYLYLGYIVKHSNAETKKAIAYFKKENEGLQDLYQVALMNDLRHYIENMIYVIPSNFLFGFSASNKFRDTFLPFYNIKTGFIFEKKIFDFTGTNVCICHFQRKAVPAKGVITFNATKFNNETRRRAYVLRPESHYKAGVEFEEFVATYKCSKPFLVEYYLDIEDVKANEGDKLVKVIDTNNYAGNCYKEKDILVNRQLLQKIKDNPLFIRTVDTGSMDGRVGLFYIRDVYHADGALVTKAKYRTHPIQVFIGPPLTEEENRILQNYFNKIVEYFRKITDSEFLTTYKYSNSSYVRKYLGLSQGTKIIETFPLNILSTERKKEFSYIVLNKQGDQIIKFLSTLRNGSLHLYNQSTEKRNFICHESI